jgi:hypothetical protein
MPFEGTRGKLLVLCKLQFSGVFTPEGHIAPNGHIAPSGHISREAHIARRQAKSAFL